MDSRTTMFCGGIQVDEPAKKRFCPDYMSNAAGPSSSNDIYDDDTDDDKESVYSWQSYETAWVADSDWSPSESDDYSVSEYEIMDEDTFEETCNSDSSTPSEITDIHFPEGLLPSSPTDNSWSPSDESGDCNGETGGFFGTKTQNSWKCLKCRAPTAAPSSFCFTCYQKRKSSRPPRPIRRSKKPESIKKTSAVSCISDCTVFVSTPSSSGDNMCTVCHVRNRDGAFVHRKTAHVACCFSCTERISKKRNAKCPICRRSIQSTIKIFFN